MTKLANTIRELTPQVGAWSAYNFPNNQPDHAILGLYEEFGELSHAVLKSQQGIRGTPESHREAGIDALCDMSIYLMDFMYRAAPDSCRDLFVDAAVDLMVDERVIGKSGNRRSSEDSRVDSAVSMHMLGRSIGFMSIGTLALYGSDFAAATKLYMATPAAILLILEGFAEDIYGVDLSDELRKTWDKVKARDWQKNPTNAHEVAEQAIHGGTAGEFMASMASKVAAEKALLREFDANEQVA